MRFLIRKKKIEVRDKIKDIKYFEKFIDEDTERVRNFSKKLESGEVAAERIQPVKSWVHDLKLGILIAKYSKGDDLSILEKEYLELLDGWKDIWESDYYNKNLKMVSLGVLLDADKVFAAQIRGMLKESNINDWLLYFLLDSWDNKKTNGDKKLLFPKSFSTLQKVVFEENKVELLKNIYLMIGTIKTAVAMRLTRVSRIYIMDIGALKPVLFQGY